MAKVPVQKGPINPDPKTSKNTLRPEKEAQTSKDNNMLYDNKCLKLKTPKNG